MDVLHLTQSNTCMEVSVVPCSTIQEERNSQALLQSGLHTLSFHYTHTKCLQHYASQCGCIWLVWCQTKSDAWPVPGNHQDCRGGQPPCFNVLKPSCEQHSLGFPLSEPKPVYFFNPTLINPAALIRPTREGRCTCRNHKSTYLTLLALWVCLFVRIRTLPPQKKENMVDMVVSLLAFP